MFRCGGELSTGARKGGDGQTDCFADLGAPGRVKYIWVHAFHRRYLSAPHLADMLALQPHSIVFTCTWVHSTVYVSEVCPGANQLGTGTFIWRWHEAP